MKKIILVLVGLVLGMSLVSAVPMVEWANTFGEGLNDYGREVQQTSDGGYIVVGTKNAENFWLIKTDSSGNIEWDKSYGGLPEQSEYIVNEIQQTSDGGYIGAGYKRVGFGSGDFWLIKTDSTGNEQWNKTYGGVEWEEAHSLDQTSDGGYIIAGYTKTFSWGFNTDFWLVKTDSGGNEQWNNVFGTGSEQTAHSVQQTSDGGFIVAGWSHSFLTSYDFWIIKTDSGGNEQWNKTYGDIGDDNAYSVQQTNDGGYIVAGPTGSSGEGAYDMWVINTDSSGNEEWNKTVGGVNYDYATSIQQTTEGGYIVTGYTESFGAGGYDIWLVKLGYDLDGDGVPDSRDLCPSTPLDEAVNINGCSCTQITIPFRDCPTDQCEGENWIDYPDDGNDTCVAGEITEIYSCEAISSIYDPERDSDDDNDGIPDTIDLCPNTPLGVEVDTNGCSAAQFCDKFNPLTSQKNPNRKLCVSADWKGNEAVGGKGKKMQPNDCYIDKYVKNDPYDDMCLATSTAN